MDFFYSIFLSECNMKIDYFDNIIDHKNPSQLTSFLFHRYGL